MYLHTYVNRVHLLSQFVYHFVRLSPNNATTFKDFSTRITNLAVYNSFIAHISVILSIFSPSMRYALSNIL